MQGSGDHWPAKSHGCAHSSLPYRSHREVLSPALAGEAVGSCGSGPAIVSVVAHLTEQVFRRIDCSCRAFCIHHHDPYLKSLAKFLFGTGGASSFGAFPEAWLSREGSQSGVPAAPSYSSLPELSASSSGALPAGLRPPVCLLNEICIMIFILLILPKHSFHHPGASSDSFDSD